VQPPRWFSPVWERDAGPPFVHPPGRSLADSEQCWCGGPFAYAQCHKNRAHHPAFKGYDADVTRKRRDAAAKCIAAVTGQCANLAIGSHIVSRAASLAPIATNGHIYGLALDDRSFRRLESGKDLLSKIGLNRASVFPAFCAHHDATLFYDLDTARGIPNADAVTAIAYRALAKVAFIKGRVLRDFDLMKRLDSGKPIQEQVRVQNEANQYLHGSWLSVRDLSRRMAMLESLLRKDAGVGSLEFHAVYFDQVLPVVATGGFTCEIDMAGRGTYDHFVERSGQTPCLAHALLPYGERTVQLLAWLRDGFEDVYRTVSMSILSHPKERWATVVCRFAFEICEMSFIAPAWYDSLTAAERRQIEMNMHSLAGISHSPACVLDSRELTVPGRPTFMHQSWLR
jgi:hypothetical protein